MIILSPQLGISSLATTGGETYDRELIKQFIKLGEKVKILLPKGKSLPAELLKSDVDRTPFGHFVPPYTFNLFALPWVIRRIKEEGKRKKVILRIHSPEYLFPTAYLVRKLYPKVVVVTHYHLDQTRKLWTAMNKKLLNMSDAVIADSQYLKERLINRVGISEKLIHVIHCGVDTEAIRPQRKKEKGRRKKEKVIMFLGRFIERKKPDFTIEIFSKLHKKHPDIKLLMVGEGPMEKELKARVANYKLQDVVEFTGPLFGEEKLKRYHSADLFLFPSEKEGFVLVVLEAMAAGLPLLVPNAMGFSEAVIDGENGLLATSGNIADWVYKAEEILFNDKWRAKMKAKSRELAINNFSWERCAKDNLSVYNLVVQ